jgi:hypothetical protein
MIVERWIYGADVNSLALELAKLSLWLDTMSEGEPLYFHLYGLTHDEADYVLETFPIVKKHDMKQFGRYRTKDLILQYYAAYAAGDMDAWGQG